LTRFTEAIGGYGQALRAWEICEIVVLSSHALEELAAICQRIVWLERGRIRMDGPSHEVVGHYREHVSRLAAEAGGRSEATAPAAEPDSSPGP
jgi:ABC-type multidrug transport system ATPase subunit